MFHIIKSLYRHDHHTHIDKKAIIVMDDDSYEVYIVDHRPVVEVTSFQVNRRIDDDKCNSSRVSMILALEGDHHHDDQDLKLMMDKT